jgi:hypothetical protein
MKAEHLSGFWTSDGANGRRAFCGKNIITGNSDHTITSCVVRAANDARTTACHIHLLVAFGCEHISRTAGCGGKDYQEMKHSVAGRGFVILLLSSLLTVSMTALAQGNDDESATAQLLPNTGQPITPTAPRSARFEPLNPGLPNYLEYLAGQAVSTVVSPDQKTLLVLTSGYNRWNCSSAPNIGNTDPSASNEYVFVYDISNKIPLKKQVLQVPNTYAGIVVDPSGNTFYVTGGVDDNVHIYDLAGNGNWSERSSSPLKLGHSSGVGLAVQPAAVCQIWSLCV